MKKAAFLAIIGLVVIAAASCASSGSGDVSSRMNFYHGQTIPDQFFKVVRYSLEEVVFEIKVDFKTVHMYHVLLNESGVPVSEGWFPTSKIGSAYSVTMKPKPGHVFEEGARYRLCVGDKNPEEVYVTSTNYQCIADYEFVLGKK